MFSGENQFERNVYEKDSFSHAGQFYTTFERKYVILTGIYRFQNETITVFIIVIFSLFE